MAGLIPQAFIDDLLDRLDIVEVVDHRVKLKKTGKNYSACCPFHDEKSPSFTVSPDKQFYHCFGCGASGNAIGFVMEYERQEFPETVETLARLAGLEVPREARRPEDSKADQEKKSIYSLLEQADDYYQTQLRQHPQRMTAVNYLKGRGLTGTIVRDFGVGFAPPGWDNILKELGSTTTERQQLTSAGMLIQRDQDKRSGNADRNHYDRFRHRIMFPIRDTRGRVIGFGARVLGDDKPKYLNSPETPVFHKGRELYGLYEARKAYSQLPRLMVVEGYMDVVALAQFDIRYGVATLGTACGEEHLTRAFRYTSEVVFCFDGDSAGRNAARRALENSLPAMQDGRRVKFLFLPEGEDPDTLVRQIGADKFTGMIETAVPLEDFLFDASAEGLDLQSMEGRARMTKLAAPLLHKLPKGVYRELMFDNLASRTGLARDTLMELVAAPEPDPAPAAKPAPVKAAPRQATASSPRATTPGNSTADTHPPEPDIGGDNYPEHYQQGHEQDYEQDFKQGYEPHYDGNAERDLDHSPDYDAPPFGEAEPHSNQARGGLSNINGRTSRYRMLPKRKVIALLLSQPALAPSVQDPEFWAAQQDPELQLFSRLLSLLQQRPHYKLHHVIGFWRAAHGETETQQLADIAGIDLIQVTRAMARNNNAEETAYDLEAAFGDTLAMLRRQLQGHKSAQSLEKLKNSDFTQLTTEERQRLVNEVLASKLAPKQTPSGE